MTKAKTADEWMEKMDAEAIIAQQELLQMAKADPQMVKNMSAWWNKWYPKAGHKRLGRIVSSMVVPTPYADK